MQTNLFIPSKIKIGFQKRSDTFTGKLAYVIYFDEKGVLRKEGSWKSWCDDSIPSIELDNNPRNGYIFNKGVQRNGYWGSGRSVIRVYDPRDFEFEVSIDNLIGLLMHSDVSKRDIVENCVFAWSGKDLVLLPTNSQEYIDSLAYTKKQSEKISTKELVKGYSYSQKKADEILTYVGHYEWFDWGFDRNEKHFHRSIGKKHVFFDKKNKSFVIPSVSTLSSVHDEQVDPDYATIVDQFFSTMNSQPIVDVVITPLKTLPNYGTMHRKVGSEFQSIYHYGYNHGSNAFYGVDNNVNNIAFAPHDRECEKINIPSTRSHFYSGGPLEKELIVKSTELGLNVNEMSIEDKKKVFIALGFGKLTYVLENKKTVLDQNF
jgi:hypothetical protein